MIIYGELRHTPSNLRPRDALRMCRAEGPWVQHHGVHEANAYYAPKPIVTFSEQQFDKGRLVERRGFAIAKVGESGRVQSVVVLAGGRKLANAKLQQAIASGIKSASPDSRRHDHFVYIAFEGPRQHHSASGELLVTLPMCNPTC